MKAFLAALSPEEERELWERMKHKDAAAKEALILHNMRLVAHVAKRYIGSSEEQEDLISIGTIGLLKAVDTFDLEFGSRFATYAIRCIDNEMLMYFRSRKKNRSQISLYEPIGIDKEGNQIHLMDVLENDETDIALQSEGRMQIRQLQENMKSVLTPREYEIIKQRYGLHGKKEKSQREIAHQLGISRSYVSRIEKKALEKLKNFLTK